LTRPRFDTFALGELDAICKALADLKLKLEGDSYSLTVSQLLLEATNAMRAAYGRATEDERLAVDRRLAGDSGLTSLEFRSGLRNLDIDLEDGDQGDDSEAF
jgi:hypothetical protein